MIKKEYYDSSQGFESFKYKKGEFPIILSAPHNVEQLRNGKIKYAESDTGPLVLLLSDLTNCHAIYKTHNLNDDANYDEQSDYKNFLINYIKSENIKMLLDIHQLSPTRVQDIEVGTAKGRNIQYKFGLIDKIVSHFKENKILNIYVDEQFSSCYEHTVSSTIARECQIPAIQIEINTALLDKTNQRYNFEGVLKSLEQIVKEIENDIEKEEYNRKTKR